MRATQVDIASIGAGGGSIAAIDLAGALLVGPASAGAVPVRRATDAAARWRPSPTRSPCSERLPPGLLGGDFRLDLDAAATALRTSLPAYDDAHAAARRRGARDAAQDGGADRAR